VGSEADRRWQEDVLRNAALTTSVHTIAHSGLHTLRIWMVDPGIAIDTIIGDSGQTPSGYLWTAETQTMQVNRWRSSVEARRQNGE